jgi:hypothetical protein
MKSPLELSLFLRPSILIVGLAFLVRLIMLFLSTANPADGADSVIYIDIGHGISDTGSFVRRLTDSYEYVTERVPLYPIYLSFFFKFYGENLLYPILIQCLVDSLTCLIIAYIGKEINPRLFGICGILAIVNLNMMIHSIAILTDTLFLALTSLFIFSMLKYDNNPIEKWVFIGCISLCLSVLTRPVMYYFIPIYLALIIIKAIVVNKNYLFTLRLFLIITTLTAVMIGPQLYGNYKRFDYFQLVSQGGAGALEWYVPLTFQYATGENVNSVISRENERLSHLLSTAPKEMAANPFFYSQQQMKVAKEELSSLNLVQISYAWLGGSLLNIFTPSISSLPELVQMKRPRFFETEGVNFVSKAFNFLTHPDNRLYLLIVLPAILITLVSRTIIAIGIWNYIRGNRPKLFAMAFLLIYTAYFLIITGPLVSAARYRLPIEPVLIIFLGYGIIFLFDSRRFFFLSRIK